MQKPNTTQIDFAQVERFFEWIGRPVFLQEFPSRYSEIAAGKNIMAALSRLARPDSDAIFWGINPMKDGATGVPGNSDIARRRLLFLDVDHPDHDQKIPATVDGKHAACEVFRRINAYVLHRGWPAPAKIDSGNGPHGYWPIDLPNDKASADLIGDFLAACRLKFGPLVDTANKDARRLGRVPGTWNRRGDATPERPHRMCRIVDLPEQSELVTAEMIQAVIDDINTEQKKAEPEMTTAKGASGEDIRPGDDYNQRASWADILIGWKIDRTNGPVTYWMRPGKDSGTSATTGYCKGESGDLLHVFSSNAAPFEESESYSKFAAFTLLSHNGDFQAAAKDLAAQGYGTQTKKSGSKTPASTGKSIVEVIHAYFLSKYNPLFKIGAAVWSQTLKRDISGAEACKASTSDLFPALQEAVDFPRTDGNPKRSMTPTIYKQYAPFAWADLLVSLPEQAESPEISEEAGDKFKGTVKGILLRLRTYPIDGVLEARPLIHWCRMWAKPGKWQNVRDMCIWIKLDGDGKLSVAMNVELFRQLDRNDLAPYEQKHFANLCERYEIAKERGTSGKLRFVVFTSAFLNELFARPADATADDYDDAGTIRAPSSSSSSSSGVASSDDEDVNV